MRFILAAVIFGFAWAAQAATTYYIDYATGADTNTDTSKAQDVT